MSADQESAVAACLDTLSSSDDLRERAVWLAVAFASDCDISQPAVCESHYN
jgi:hypothetical protein